MNKMWIYRFPEICKKLYNIYIKDLNLKYGNILAKLEFILDSVRVVDEDDLILWNETEEKVPLSELKWEEFVEEEDVIPSESPQPTEDYVIHSTDGTVRGTEIKGNLNYSFGLVVGDVWKVTATSPSLAEPYIWQLGASRSTVDGHEYIVLRSMSNIKFWIVDNAEDNLSGNIVPKQNSTAYSLQDCIVSGQRLNITLTFEKISNSGGDDNG